MTVLLGMARSVCDGTLEFKCGCGGCHPNKKLKPQNVCKSNLGEFAAFQRRVAFSARNEMEKNANMRESNGCRRLSLKSIIGKKVGAMRAGLKTVF